MGRIVIRVVFGLFAIGLLVGLYMGYKSWNKSSTTAAEAQAELNKKEEELKKLRAEADAHKGVSASASASISRSSRSNDGSGTVADKATARAEVKGVVAVEGLVSSIKNGNSISASIDQSSSVAQRNAEEEITADVKENIKILGNGAADRFEQGEADKKRKEGEAMVIEAKGTAGAKLNKTFAPIAEAAAKYSANRTPARVKVEPIKVDVNVSGTVSHDGKVQHEGTVNHKGEVKISSGTISINGVTKKVTIREIVDRCGNVLSRQVIE